MKPVTILLQPDAPCLTVRQIKYAFETLLTLAGIPWHFLHPTRPEPCDIFYGSAPRHPCKLFIQQAKADLRVTQVPLTRVRDNGTTFLTFANGLRQGPILERSAGRVSSVWNDLIMTTYYLLTGRHEQSMKRDRWNRPQPDGSFFDKHGLIRTPLINQYARLLAETFQSSHPAVPPWPHGRKYAVVLTHDVDYPAMIRSVEALRYVLRNGRRTSLPKVLDYLKGRETFWRFTDWLQLEREYRVHSAFYFCGRRGFPMTYLVAPDPFYDVRHAPYRRVMRRIRDEGGEVGMHGSFRSYRSEHRLRAEKEEIERAVGSTIVGNRHHRWHIDPHNPARTARRHAGIGLIYDSSLSFERRSGFRNGISSPFHLFDPDAEERIPVLQLPPTLMDDHLFGYSKVNGFDDTQSHIDDLLDAVRTSAGVFVADFHVRVFNQTSFPMWREAYEYLLSRIAGTNGDAWCELPHRVAEHWLSRERMLHAYAKDDDPRSHQ